MNNFIELITAPLAFGDSRIFEVTGDYFEIIDAQYPVDITLSDRNGVMSGLMRSAEQSFFLKNTPFGSIQIHSDQAQIIRFGYGSGEAGTRRTSGVVSVIDGGKSRTLSSSAFSIVLGAGAVPGNYSRTQLFNPAGSNRRLIVKSYAVNLPVAGSVYLHSINSMLANPSSAILNTKMPGGTNPLAIGRFEQILTLTPSPNLLDLLIFQAADQKRISLQEPLVLNPGWGIVAESTVFNTALNLILEWVEESLM